MDEEFDPTSIGAVAVEDEPEFDPQSIGAVPVEEEFDPTSIGAVPVEDAPAAAPVVEKPGFSFNGKAALDALLSPFNDFTAAAEGSLPSNPRRDAERAAGRLLTKEQADDQLDKSKEAMQTPIVTLPRSDAQTIPAGIGRGLTTVAESLTTGENIALLASIGGAPRAIQKAAAAGFGAMMAKEIPGQIESIKEAKTPSEMAERITETAATAAMTLAAAKHAGGRSPIKAAERAASMEQAKAVVEAQRPVAPLTAQAVAESMPKATEALATPEALPPERTPATAKSEQPTPPVVEQSPALVEGAKVAPPESISKPLPKETSLPDDLKSVEERIANHVRAEKPLAYATTGDGKVTAGHDLGTEHQVKLELTPVERKEFKRAESDLEFAETKVERDAAKQRIQQVLRPATERAISNAEPPLKPTSTTETAPAPKAIAEPNPQAAESAVRSAPLESEAVGGPGAMGPVESAEMQARRVSTSTKNAVMEAERAARNADPIIKQARQTNQATLDKAETLIESNPNHARALVQGLKEGTKREVSEIDEAVLLYEKVRLRNERSMEADRASDPLSTPEERLVAKQKWEELEARINDVDVATAASGTIWGRLGQFRQRLIAEDFTFDQMERKARVAKGEPLTPAESTKIKEQSDQIADLQKKLADLQSKKEGEAATGAADETVKKIRQKATGPAKDTSAEREATVDALKKRVKDGESVKDLGTYVQRLAEQFVRAGVKERDPLIDAVHGVLKTIEPEITRRETMDAISGYGDFKPLTGDAVKMQLRDLKGQMQQVAKIDDMMAKKAPAKTGVERRNPSDEERRLIKEVNELKKKGGFEVTNPEQQLKTALDAIKTRLKNQIKDITNQIDTGEKPVKREGTPYDDQALRLKDMRDRVRQTLEEIEGKPEMSDAQRVKIATNALDKAIAETQRQIKTGDLYPERVVKKAPTSAELEAKRQQLDALRAERDLLKTLDTSMTEVNREISLINAIARAEKGLPEVKTGKPTADTARVAELKTKLAEVKAARDSSPEALARKIESASEAVKRSIESLDKRLKAGDTSPQSKGGTRPDSPELQTLRAERDALQALMQELRNAEKPKLSADEIALKAFKARTAAKIVELNDRMARGDFAAKPKRELKPDKEAIDLAFKIEKVKREYAEARLADQLSKRTIPQRVKDAVADVFHTSRAIMTGGEFSALFRQGKLAVLSRPITTAKGAVPAMFKAFKSERGEFEVMEEIKSRPNAKLYKESGLRINDPTDFKAAQLEGNYRSRWANQIPLVAGSGRAYSAFINRLRADVFDVLTSTLAKRKGSITPDEAKVIATYVNEMTGSGGLGVKGERATDALNVVYFSPRFVASRFQMLVGHSAWKGNAATRRIVAEEYARILTGAAVMYSLYAMASDDDKPIEKDPRSGEFAKVRFGETRLDPLAGLIQATVLMSRIYSGQTKDGKGKIVNLVDTETEKVPYGKDDLSDVTKKFNRSKMSPVAGAIYDRIMREDFRGMPITAKGQLLGMVQPMTYGSIYDAMREHGVPKGTALSILALFGEGVNTYEKKEK